MANKPVAQHVLKYKGGGNVQVFPLLVGVNTGAQDGSDVGTGTPSGLAIVETATNAGTFAHNRNIEFLNDRYALVGCNAISVSGVFKKGSGGGTGLWGQVQYNNLGRPTADGTVSGLHVLHPSGVPTLCYMLFETGNDLHFYSTVDGTTGASWAAADGTVELNTATPSSVGQSIVFKDSIFWAHASFVGGAGTGALTEYNLKTSILTRYNASAVLSSGQLGCNYALHVHDSVLFAFGWDAAAQDGLTKLVAGVFTNVSSKTGQVAAPASNPAGSDGHPVMFTDNVTGDLIVIMTGRRLSNDSSRAKVNRIQNATSLSPIVSDISTTVMGATEGADKYLEGGLSANFDRRWSVFVDTIADPTTPRTYLTTWIPGGSTETWEWISSTTGGYGEMQLVGAGAGISDDHALPYDSIGGGHRTPRNASVEIVDTPEEILTGTKVLFRGYGEDSTTTAPSSTLTFYGADTQGTPSTLIPIVPGSLSVGAGFLTNLEAYYKFEGPDTRVDSSGNGLSLTETGIVSQGTGIFGNGALFPGTNGNYLSRPGDDATLDLGQNLAPFSISVWVDMTTIGTNGRVCSKGNENTDGWLMNINPTGQVRFVAHPGAPIFSMTSNASITAGAGLQHILLTSDGVTARLYVDSVEEDTIPAIAITGSASRFFVGNRFQNDDPLDGLLDELAIWTRYITPLEVEALYNANSGGGAGKELEETTALPITPSISGNTIVDFTADNGSTLYSVVLEVDAPGIDIEEGDIGIIITDLI